MVSLRLRMAESSTNHRDTEAQRRQRRECFEDNLPLSSLCLCVSVVNPSAYFTMPRFTSSSAHCTALLAAPLRRLLATTHRHSAFGLLGSCRTRPTKT